MHSGLKDAKEIIIVARKDNDLVIWQYIARKPYEYTMLGDSGGADETLLAFQETDYSMTGTS